MLRERLTMCRLRLSNVQYIKKENARPVVPILLELYSYLLELIDKASNLNVRTLSVLSSWY